LTLKETNQSSDNEPKTISKQSTLGESMFKRQTSTNHSDFDSLSHNNGSEKDDVIRSQYRANYPVNFDPYNLEDTFFKSLES
jgi:hypothetical protein